MRSIRAHAHSGLLHAHFEFAKSKSVDYKHYVLRYVRSGQVFWRANLFRSCSALANTVVSNVSLDLKVRNNPVHERTHNQSQGRTGRFSCIEVGFTTLVSN